MALCEEYKIPHSAFLLWEDEDRAKALAYFAEKSERCSLCGTAQWEWDEDRYAYTTEEKFCKGCYYKHVQSEGHDRLPGTTVELTKLTLTQKAQLQVREAERARKRKEE